MKEIIISTIIIICIVIGNQFNQKYKNNATETTTEELTELKKSISDGEQREKLKNTIDTIHEEWDKKYEKLAYYIEHNELEKIESGLTLVRSYIETEEKSESIGKIDETIYLLRHIEDKNKFNLKNIF